MTKKIEHKSHLTAISRKTLPVPTRWLLEQGAIVEPVLDYGCGKCHEINSEHFFDCDGYDPYYRPSGLPDGKDYATILCIYVLCTIPTWAKRLSILRRIQSLLYPKIGRAFIAVRNDRPRNGWGRSNRGTYQGRVRRLPLHLVREVHQYRIYLLTTEDKLV
jgi:hypothetical protein